jgi:hypothetical protein
MAAPNAVNAGQTAYLDLPLGVRYKGLWLIYGGTTFTPALMDAIRIYANNKIIHNLTGSRRDALNQFDGLIAASTYKALYIPFHRIGMADKTQEFMTYLGTDHKCHQSPDGTKQLQLQVDIDAGASAPTLQVYAEICKNDPDQQQALLRTETWFENVANTGDYLHQKKYSGDAARPYISRMSFFDTPTNISSFYYLKDQAMITQRTSLLNRNIQVTDNDSVKVSPTSAVIFDTAEQGNHRCALHVQHIDDFEVHTVHTATNSNLPVVVETLGKL